MNKKAESNNIVYIVAIIVVALFAAWYTSGGGDALDPGATDSPVGDISNGYWNVATEQCWLDKDHGPGVYLPTGQISTTMYQCCLNQEGQQIDCNNPTKLLQFAIYEGLEGIFSVAHGVTITNTGNVDLSQVWIESATWSPVNAVLTSAYSGIVGSVNGYSNIAKGGGFAVFSTNSIDLQSIGGEPGFPTTYDLSLVTKGSANGLSDISKTTPASITVEKESIGFDVSVNLGA